ncbi:MAG: sugar ABC transporter substrate-binding protein [Alphaproteobacteria bacterium]|nr:MAG: sugar ABC transporter substrate-binding protein [Alphaproteobacteria bacterium]
MRRLHPIATALALATMLWSGARPAGAEVTIAISCSSLGVEAALCRTGAEDWAEATGNRVELVSTPADANERLALYQSLLAAESGEIDVFQIDVIWPGVLAGHFVDLADHLSAEDLAGHFDILIDNNTVDGALVAAPWFVDAGLLYYRRDLLEAHGRAVPETWDELAETAALIVEAERASGAAELQGFVWQGRAYEGLACNALEWIYSHGGGTIVDSSGAVTLPNEAAERAIAMARGWIGTISPRGVLNYAEEDARGVFQSGRAVFMRNWPYAWALANAEDSPVRGKVGIAPLPKGPGAEGRHAAVLGGQQLAVSRYSEHPEEAADLVRHLTGAAEQKRRALEGAFNPTRPDLYEDPDLIAANPFLAEFPEVLANAVARPSTVTGRRYNQLSGSFVQAVHDALSGRGEPQELLAALAERLEQLSRGGNW